MNSVNLLGRIVANPELRHTQSGTSVTSFTIAVDGGKEKDSNERITDFIDCIAWSNTAELIAKYWEKGRMIAVSGSLNREVGQTKEGISVRLLKSRLIVHILQIQRSQITQIIIQKKKRLINSNKEIWGDNNLP
jgi:single-strand DNA-binding protein